MPDDRISHSMMEEPPVSTPNWSETLASAWGNKDSSPRSGSMSPEDRSGVISAAVTSGERVATASGSDVCVGPPGTGKSSNEPKEIEFPPIAGESPKDAENTNQYPGRFKVPEGVSGLELLLRASKTAAEVAIRGLKDSLVPTTVIPVPRVEELFTPSKVPSQKDSPNHSEGTLEPVNKATKAVLKALADGVAFPISGLVPLESPRTERHQPPRGVGPQDIDQEKPGKAAQGDKSRAEEERSVLRKILQKGQRN